MGLTSASRTFQLLKDLFDVKTSTNSYLPTPCEKIHLPLTPVEAPFPRCTPEEAGISSDHIRRFLEELENDDSPRPVKVRELEMDDQISMLDLSSQQVAQALSAISVETLTPIEAMNELYKLKRMLE